MASSKPDLARAGTMQATAKDGENFLDRNLSDWRKPYLMDHFEGDKQESDEEGSDADETPAKKPKISKHTTMKGTAKEAEALLADGRPDDDAATRGQQKKIENIKAEKPAAKKARMARDNTMAATSKEGRSLLAGEKLADTRQETKRKSKGSLKRATTIDAVVAEAEAVYGDMETSSGRQLRKRPEAKKPALQKAGTMQTTAKEGKAYLKRSKKSKK